MDVYSWRWVFTLFTCRELPTSTSHWPMLFKCWPTVFDAGPTLKQHWVFASCFLRGSSCHYRCRPGFLYHQYIIYVYCFTSFSAHCGNIATEGSPKPDYAILLFRMSSRVLYSAQYLIGSTVHSRPLNSLEHCICTTAMTSIRPTGITNI